MIVKSSKYDSLMVSCLTKMARLLEDAAKILSEIGDAARESKVLDDESLNRLSEAYASLFFVMYRMAARGLLDPEVVRRSGEYLRAKLARSAKSET